MTSRYQSGWRRSTPRSTRTNCSRLSSKSAKSRLATKRGRTRSLGERAGDGPCQCQHRWRSWPRFQKDQSLPLWWGHYKKAQQQPRRPWELQQILDGKKGSLTKTSQCQTEATDKVWTGRRSGPWKRWRLCTRGQSRSTRTSPMWTKGVLTDAG